MMMKIKNITDSVRTNTQQRSSFIIIPLFIVVMMLLAVLPAASYADAPQQGSQTAAAGDDNFFLFETVKAKITVEKDPALDVPFCSRVKCSVRHESGYEITNLESEHAFI